MLLDLRETVRNSKPIKYTLITLICIPFMLFGIGSYFSGGGVQVVAKVNGVDISQQQLDRAYQQQRQQLAQMFGGQLPEALDNEAQLRQQALDQLVSQQVLEGEVENQAFAVGDKTLSRSIREMPAFQVDGKFDRETYEYFAVRRPYGSFNQVSSIQASRCPARQRLCQNWLDKRAP